jgi:hypothetical protein
MNCEEWLRRYRDRLLERRPGLTNRDLYDLANVEVYYELCGDYPEHPEKAADAEIGFWDTEEMGETARARAPLVWRSPGG